MTRAGPSPGFGSAISPTYPIALGCDDYAFPSDNAYVKDCTQGDWGPLDPKNPYVDTNGTLSFCRVGGEFAVLSALAVS